VVCEVICVVYLPVPPAADQHAADARYVHELKAGLALTSGCHWIGYMDHTGCHVDHTGCHRLVSSTICPTRVALTHGCQIGYMDHT
jgi:hypothetical protein